MLKFGPCKICLVKPVCHTLCDEKLVHLQREASIEKKKGYQDVTIEDIYRQLKKEEMGIRKIEVGDESM